MDAATVGDLQGRYALLPLVTRVEEIAASTRASLVSAFSWFRRHIDELRALAEDLREGRVDAASVAVASAAFRPSFHAARGADHLIAEQWTEATLRYVLAGETLVRDVVMSALHEQLDVSMTPAQITTHWRKTAPALSRLAGKDLESEPAWTVFNRVYADRNTRYAHGHQEATVADAFRARESWIGLRDMLQATFSKPGSTDRLGPIAVVGLKQCGWPGVGVEGSVASERLVVGRGGLAWSWGWSRRGAGR